MAQTRKTNINQCFHFSPTNCTALHKYSQIIKFIIPLRLISHNKTLLKEITESKDLINDHGSKYVRYFKVSFTIVSSLAPYSFMNWFFCKKGGEFRN